MTFKYSVAHEFVALSSRLRQRGLYQESHDNPRLSGISEISEIMKYSHASYISRVTHVRMNLPRAGEKSPGRSDPSERRSIERQNRLVSLEDEPRRVVLHEEGGKRRRGQHLLQRLGVISRRRRRGHSGADIALASARSRGKAAQGRKGNAKREVATWVEDLIYVWGLRARACTGWLYDFAHFTLKAFSWLMDDFSLTNSDCELSAREIPRTRGGEGGEGG